MSKVFEVYFETPIKVSQEKLFEFHLDTKNLPKITPPNTKVEIIKLPLPMAKGNIIKLDITKFFMTQRWEIQIKEFEPLYQITDLALKSPLEYFEHDHIFEKVDGRNSKLIDRVRFSLPFYPLSLLVLPLVKLDMKKMFAYRHQQTKKILE
jgi:ligand-binding SRPBCC domain-containing protein